MINEETLMLAINTVDSNYFSDESRVTIYSYCKNIYILESAAKIANNNPIIYENLYKIDIDTPLKYKFNKNLNYSILDLISFPMILSTRSRIEILARGKKLYEKIN